ncbi:PspC domain-containing protein [Nocardioides litoris]|uniref:PspC domain-containing protein n=1 Tax=Nocardioides litoris TaxID=1926648 RepID=UPI001476C0AC|nr:PspC domain-containing protein [Nocardioides litoris]
MTTTPPEAPPGPDPGADGPDTGPRTTRDEVRDLGRLRRSAHDRKIAGVAGGLARHLDLDPLVVRVVLAVLVLFGGAGLVLYAVCWLVVPEEATGVAVVRTDERSRSAILLVGLVLAGLSLVGDTVGGWDVPWPVLVVGLVVVLALSTEHRRTHPWLRRTDDAGTPPPTWTAPPPAYGAAKPAPVPPARPRRGGPLLLPYALAVIALGVGVLGIADLAGADVPGSAYPAFALGTCAGLLLLGAFWGRAGGLIALGLLAAVATAGATAADRVDAGRVAATPTTTAAVSDRYALTFGEIDLDLSQVTDPEALDGRTVEVEVEVAGRIQVTVPDDVDVVVRSDLDEGGVTVLGDRLADGQRTTTVDGGTDAPRLTLDTRVALGEIRVDRAGES